MNKKLCALLLSAVMCFCFTACSNTQSERSTTSAAATTMQATTVAAASTTQATTQTTTKTTAVSTTSTTAAQTTTATTKAKPKATAKKKKKSNAVTCTVNVECKAILDNMSKLKEGHEEFVPDDGYIIKDYTYKGKKCDTAYDALKKACKDSGIKLTARSTSYGVYISGINNLDEFDCGNQSGWLYSVNGKYPNTTCGNVEISTDDTITFEYTCSQ